MFCRARAPACPPLIPPLVCGMDLNVADVVSEVNAAEMSV